MIDCFWLTKTRDTCARCRWDEWWVDDLISGKLKRPGSWWPEIVHHEDCHRLPRQEFGIVCFPAGAHQPEDIRWLSRQLRQLDRVILFMTSDEVNTFPVASISHPNLRLWVQPPYPSAPYPQGTSYLGFGSARAAQEMHLIPAQGYNWTFLGQSQHERRDQMIEELRQRDDGHLLVSEGFLQGLSRTAYLGWLASAKAVPCPPGNVSEDSFRFSEALDMGCVPIVDLIRPRTMTESGYWQMVYGNGCPVPYVTQWEQVHAQIENIVDCYPAINIQCHEWWHHYRRGLAERLRDQMPFTPATDRLTVLIPTSPIASHPSTAIIEETVDSIRERTDAEILIMVDGVRREQRHYFHQYQEYVRRLMRLSETWGNATPVVYRKHFHQAAMTSATLPLVSTPYIMFVEHDTPLIGEIDLDEVMATMERDQVNLMRFYHEVAIHPEHKMLMVGGADKGWQKTMQWSQRPHIALRGFYEWMLGRYFTSDARTMIEDVMHGIVQHFEFQWEDWRLGIWHPEGDIKRSTHLDGRAGDPKYEQKFRFSYPDNVPPPGAPVGRVR